MNRTKMFTCAVLNLVIATSLCASAPGLLDTTFNPLGTPPGTVTTVIGLFSEGKAVAIQTDGKIVVVGQADPGSGSQFTVVRYNTDGSLDTTFNGTGKVTTDLGISADARAVAIQVDGKIVAAGFVNEGAGDEIAVVRYNTDGTLDTTFNGTGIVITAIGSSADGNAVAIQQDGKIVVAGVVVDDGIGQFAAVRYNTDGTLDTTFNSGGPLPGTVTTSVGFFSEGKAVAIQTDGKIVVVGQGAAGFENVFGVVRYNTDGSVDTTFNGTGIVTTDLGTSADGKAVAIQADGKIVAAGTATQASVNQFAVVRYNTDGSLDTTFNGTGKVLTLIGTFSAGSGVAIQQNGKIVVAGLAMDGSNQFAVARYTTDGALDTTFNSGGTQPGTVTTLIEFGAQGNGVAIQQDGKIVVAGVAFGEGSPNRFAVARYNGDSATPPVSACALRFINKYGPRL